MEKTLKVKTKNVTANIRTLRQYREYSQEYVASKIKISQNGYSKLELGAIRLTNDHLFGIADVLEVDPLILLTIKPDDVLKTAISDPVSNPIML